jgi:hypothetical protein
MPELQPDRRTEDNYYRVVSALAATLWQLGLAAQSLQALNDLLARHQAMSRPELLTRTRIGLAADMQGHRASVSTPLREQGEQGIFADPTHGNSGPGGRLPS